MGAISTPAYHLGRYFLCLEGEGVVINTTAYHLGRYFECVWGDCHKHNSLLLGPIQPSSPSTKEFYAHRHHQRLIFVVPFFRGSCPGGGEDERARQEADHGR